MGIDIHVCFLAPERYSRRWRGWYQATLVAGKGARTILSFNRQISNLDLGVITHMNLKNTILSFV